MRTTTTIALFLLVSAIFAYPTLRGEGTTKFTEYAEDHLELIDEITLDDKSVVVRRAPATKHALGEVTIEKRKKEREYVLTKSSDLGVTLRKSEDHQYWEWYDANNNLLNRCPANPYISEIVDVNTNGYWLMFEELKEDPYDFIEEQYDFDGPLIYAADFRYNVESSNFPSQSGVVIYDQNGNKMTQVDLECGDVSYIEMSPSGNYFIVAAHPKTFLMSIDGLIKREFMKSGGVYISFSPSEDLAVLGPPLPYVIDLETGEILAKIHGTYDSSTIAISDKDAGIVAVRGNIGILVFDIWAEKQIARFRQNGTNIQLSGDGRLLSFRGIGKVVTYRLDGIDGEQSE